MESVIPYVPRHLRHAIAASRVESPPFSWEEPAALLLSDVSGFTALTERLSSRGREGAEEMAGLLDGAFVPAVEALEARGGSVAVFGGDALLTLFPGAGSARRALDAAQDLQRQFGERGPVATSAGPTTLGLSQALHHGIVRMMVVGTEKLAHHVVAGDALRELARMEEAAPPGSLHTSAELEAELAVAAPEPRHFVEPAAGGLDRFLPAALRPVLGLQAGGFRRVAVLFLESRGDELERVQAFHQLLSEALSDHGGMLLKSDVSPAGTRWLAVFGTPVAHEDDPLRAARAAAALQSRGALGHARGGLAAGVVANLEIGPRSRRCFDVLGDAVNTAARACGSAAWGEVLAAAGVEAELHELSWESRPPGNLKGKSHPVPLAALLGLTRGGGARRGPPTLRGRRAELRLLGESLDASRKGDGRTVYLAGPAGIGKSRLAAEIAGVAEARGCLVLRGRAPSSGATGLEPIVQVVAQAVDGLPDGPDPASRLAASGERLRLGPADVALLTELLGTAGPAAPVGPRESGRAQAVAVLLSALSRERPLVVVLDDLHWADAATRDAVVLLEHVLRGRSVLLLLLARGSLMPSLASSAPRGQRPSPAGSGDAFEPPPGATGIELGPLPEDEISGILAERVGPSSLVPELAARSGGNPLHAEELARHSQGCPGPLPETLESLLASRLHALSPRALHLAQAASVLGVSAPLPLLDAMAAGSWDSAEGTELRDAGVMEPAGAGAAAFRQPLLRDAAYASLLGEARRELHRRAARALASRARARESGLLAHHWLQGGDEPSARDAFLRAARGAASLGLLRDADVLFGRYLDLAREMTRERLDARIELADKVVTLMRGPAEAQPLYEESLAEAEALGDDVLRAHGLRGLGLCHLARGEMEAARGRFEAALAVYRAAGWQRGEAIAGNDLGNLCRAEGRRDEALVHFTRARAMLVEQGDALMAVRTLGNIAVIHHEEGRFTEAEAAYRAALSESQEISDLASGGYALGNLAVLLWDSGRRAEAMRLYREALEMHRRNGNRRGEGHVSVNLGIALHEDGSLAEARAHLALAHELLVMVGDVVVAANCQSNLANVLRDMGDVAEARRLQTEALASLRASGARHFEGVALSSLGGLELLLGRFAEARELASQALELQRGIHDGRDAAVTLEILAGIALEQGDVAEAERHVEEALGTFRKLDDRRWVALSLGRLAQVRLAQGRPADAVPLAEEALAGLRDVRDRRGEGSALALLARARRIATGLAGLALIPAMEARQVLGATGDRVALAGALCELAICLRRTGASAAAYLDEAVAIASALAFPPGAPIWRTIEEARRDDP